MKLIKLLLLVSLFFTLNSCIFFSTYQSARMLDKKEFEVSAFASVQEDYNEPEDKNSQFGLQGAVGITKKFNLRLRYALLHRKDILTDDQDWEYVDDDDAYISSHVELEPKWSPGTQEHFALSCPLGGRFEVGSTDFQVSPTIMGSVYPSETVAITLAAKAPYLFVESAISGAATLGLTVTPKNAPLTITPEFGFVWGDYGTMTSWGIAFGVLKKRS